jgi:hypothetical protein
MGDGSGNGDGPAIMAIRGVPRQFRRNAGGCGSTPLAIAARLRDDDEPFR